MPTTRIPPFTARPSATLFRFAAVALASFATCIQACSSAATTALPDAGTDGGSSEVDAGLVETGSVQDGSREGTVDGGPSVRVRIMAANTTSGTLQSYELPGIRIFQGLKPDIAMVQEFNYKSGDRRALVDTAFGPEFGFYVEPRTTGIPNAVVTRYPILESGVWIDASANDRGFAYARIDVPGTVDLWAVSVHLLTSDASSRSSEAKQLAAYIKASVPAGDYVVVGGDFNTTSPGEQTLADLSALVSTASPYPADDDGNANTSANRTKPHDWLLARTNLVAHEEPVVLGATSFPAGLVFDSRVFRALGDVAPILASDSAASGMQHMPIVRDFSLGGVN